MEASILKSTKKILGVVDTYTAFDLDICTHINSAISVLNQLGVGVQDFVVDSNEATWEEFIGDDSPGLNMVRSYIFLKVRMLFDPPPTSFGIDAMKTQIEEFEWRISSQREWNNDPSNLEGV